MNKEIRVRFAPSPTGDLHVGGARTALFNWLYAKKNKGKFILRIEDTDRERNSQSAANGILQGLSWLGIDWDEGPFFQSQRQDVYNYYFKKLVDSGHTYTEENGAVRFRSPGQVVTLDDKICGQVKIDRTKEPDITIRRPDGSYIFHFVNVVDDIEMKISHVIRGEDHLFNTGKHIELFQAFGATPPVYAHIPLILNEDGSKMSKRQDGAAVSFYQYNGFLPESLVNYLCLLGWSPKDGREILSITEICGLFDWSHMNKSNAKFDMEKCRWMNAQYISKFSLDDFISFCYSYLPIIPTINTKEEKLKAALVIVKPKVKSFSEVGYHLNMIFNSGPLNGDLKAKITENAEKVNELKAALESIDDWKQENIGAAAERIGFPLSLLRILCLGEPHGVDLLPAIEIIGKIETISRIKERS